MNEKKDKGMNYQKGDTVKHFKNIREIEENTGFENILLVIVVLWKSKHKFTKDKGENKW